MWKANGRKRGQRNSVLHAITFHSTTRPRLFGSHFGVPKNFMSPSNGERGQNTASMADFFNNNERFLNKYSNAQNEAFMKCGIDFV